MTDTAVAADFNESLDIESGLTAKVTLDLAVMIYILTKLRDVILGQVLDSYIGINSCCGDNIACGFATDAVDIGQSDLDSFLSRQVNTCLGFSQMTITFPLRLIILHFSHIFLTEGLTFIRIPSFYLERHVMRPFVRSYGDISTVTLSPGRMRM